MSFLPDNYKVPVENKYFKFVTGENMFRVLSDAITGWEWWTTEIVDGKEFRKPNRIKDYDPETREGIPAEEYDEEQPPKHFWAFVVWNYNEEKVQILEITQKSIQMKMRALSQSKGWGDPKRYDIQVTKTGEKLATKYELMPIPPEPVDTTIAEKYKSISINLNALYDGKDPFAKETEDVDPSEAVAGVEAARVQAEKLRK